MFIIKEKDRNLNLPELLFLMRVLGVARISLKLVLVTASKWRPREALGFRVQQPAANTGTHRTIVAKVHSVMAR